MSSMELDFHRRRIVGCFFLFLQCRLAHTHVELFGVRRFGCSHNLNLGEWGHDLNFEGEARQDSRPDPSLPPLLTLEKRSAFSSQGHDLFRSWGTRVFTNPLRPKPGLWSNPIGFRLAPPSQFIRREPRRMCLYRNLLEQREWGHDLNFEGEARQDSRPDPSSRSPLGLTPPLAAIFSFPCSPLRTESRTPLPQVRIPNEIRA